MTSQALYDDVLHYDALGEHRTGTAEDEATTRWIARRLSEAGFAVSLQAFRARLFEPSQCRIELGHDSIQAFPAWPVTPTRDDGLNLPLGTPQSTTLPGMIAVVPAPYGHGAAWGEPAWDAIRRGAAAVVIVTEGPTADIVALNAPHTNPPWPVPVVIAGGRDGDALLRRAESGQSVRLVSNGKLTPDASATNVIGRRIGSGKTIVVSTPKSGWFHCAGERGSGIAVFLSLAAWLARDTAASLEFVATSGHELGYAGGEVYLREAPAPDSVKVWLHLGANVAVQNVRVTANGPIATAEPITRRTLTASAELIETAQRAFAGLAGYEQPRTIDAHNAVGELELFHAAGHGPIAGIVGASPLFHTPLDRAELATTPSILEPVANACREFLRQFA